MFIVLKTTEIWKTKTEVSHTTSSTTVVIILIVTMQKKKKKRKNTPQKLLIIHLSYKLLSIIVAQPHLPSAASCRRARCVSLSSKRSLGRGGCGPFLLFVAPSECPPVAHHLVIHGVDISQCGQMLTVIFSNALIACSPGNNFQGSW